MGDGPEFVIGDRVEILPHSRDGIPSDGEIVEVYQGDRCGTGVTAYFYDVEWGYPTVFVSQVDEHDLLPILVEPEDADDDGLYYLNHGCAGSRRLAG